MKARLFPIVACAFLAAILLIGYAQRGQVEFAEHRPYDSKLDRLREEDARLNLSMLKARNRFSGDYDALSEQLLALRQTIRELGVAPSFVKAPQQELLRHSLAESARLLERKETLLEDFKSENALLNNSLSYLPAACRNLTHNLAAEAPSRTLAGTVDRLLEEVLILSLEPSQDAKPNIQSLLEEVDTWQADHPGHPLASEVARVEAHARSIVLRNGKVDALMGEILSLPADQTAANTIQIYDTALAQALDHGEMVRWMLCGGCLLLLLGVAYTIYALDASNRHLERRVAARTSELSTENERRRHAEEQHRGSERFLQSTLDALSAHIAILDETGAIMAVNAAWHHFAETNDAVKEAVSCNSNYLEICDAATGDCSVEAKLVAAGIRRVIAGQEREYELEYPCHCHTEEQWFVARITSFRGEDSLHIVVAHENVTTRARAQQNLRRHERELRVLFDLIPALVWYKDTRNNFLRVNNRVVESTGSSREAIEGRSAYEVYPDEASAYYADDLEVIHSGEPKFGIVEQLPGPGSQKLWIQTDKVPVFGDDGRVVGLVVMAKDVTEREIAEEALRQSEARFSGAFEHAPIGVALVAPDGRWIKVNQALCGIVGYSEPELLDLTFQDITHPDDLPVGLESVRRLLAGEIHTYQLEKRYIHRLGHAIVVSVHVSLVRDVEREPSYLIAQIQDITDRRAAESELRRKTALLEAQLDSTIDGILVVDLQGTKILQNKRLAELFSMPALISNESNDAAQVAWVMSRLQEPERFAARIAYLYAHPDVVGRDEIRLLDGTILDRYSAPVIGPDGCHYGRIWAFRDVTERANAEEKLRESEARFAGAFEHAPIGVGLCRPDGRWLKVNQALCQVVGYTEEDLLAKTFQEITVPEDLGITMESVNRLLTGKIRSYQIEKRYRHAHGHAVTVLLNVSLVRDAQGQPVHFIAQVQDITERKRADTELANVNRKLMETSRQVGMAEVATSVLHNVGNVLNSVNVSASVVSEKLKRSKAANLGRVTALLQEHSADFVAFLTTDARGRNVPAYLQQLHETLGQERQDMLAEVESLRKNVDHINEIVSMQQAYAKVSGMTECLKITDLVEDSLRMNEAALLRHAILIERAYQCEPVIETERHKVLQVLVNLIRNAKYACEESGQAEKKITLAVEQMGDRVTISVTDTGVGIPPENLSRIFNHGFTTRKEGHGFGLHSAALAARELGGSLNAWSDGLGRGASFAFELPFTACRTEPPDAERLV